MQFLHTVHCVIFNNFYNVEIAFYFAYPHWYLKKDVTHVKFGTRTETTI